MTEYKVRVDLEDGRKYVQSYGPLNDEDELISLILYANTEGNDSCDCNKRIYLADEEDTDTPDENPCGDSLKIKHITLIRPDMTEETLL